MLILLFFLSVSFIVLVKGIHERQKAIEQKENEVEDINLYTSNKDVEYENGSIYTTILRKIDRILERNYELAEDSFRTGYFK